MKPTKEEFIQYFITEGHTGKETRKHFGMANGTFYKCIEEYNIEIPKEEKKLPTKEELEQFYIVENHSFKETKKHFNISTTVFYKLVEQYNIVKSEEAKVKATESTMLKRYGVKNARHIQSVNDRIANTNLEKYGSISPLGNKEIRAKIEDHFNDKYGGYPLANKEVQEKSKQTYLEKYGVDNISKTESMKQTLRRLALQRDKEASLEKRIQTNLEKFGTPFNTQSHYSERTLKILENKDNFIDYIKSLKPEQRTKHYIADDLEVHTTNIGPKIREWGIEYLITYKPHQSRPEDRTHEALVKIFPKVKRQYKSERYPFYCDFYIPDIDTFIECQYGVFHGPGEYDPTNEEHQKYLLEIQEKAKISSWYERIINTWTYRDPLKRKIAKENNLNYLEFFSEEEFNEWYKLYKGE